MIVHRHIVAITVAVIACIAAVGVVSYLRYPDQKQPSGLQPQQTASPRADADEIKPVTTPPTDVSTPEVRSPSSPALDKSARTIERMKAVDALPRIQPSEAMSALHSILKEPSEDEALRNLVANKLRECGDPNLVADLTAMLWDENETPKWRNYCVQHLYQCYADKPDPAVLDTLFQAAEADERMVRICAVWSLARVATPHDKSKAPGEETLGKIRALALLALREKDAHFLITTAGVQSCARLGMAEALPDIRALASSDGTKPVSLRIAAVAALGELKDTESLPLLERLSREAAGQLQLAARLALKRISEAEARGEATVPPEADRPEDKF